MDRIWRENNAERKKANDKAWYEANRERHYANTRALQQRYPERHPRYARAWAARNPEKARARWRRGNGRRHARMYAASVGNDSFSYEEIFERDRWICGICEDPVDRTLVRPNPLSASLDHIMPLSKGGAHSRDNVQLAHLQCNVRKSDKIMPVLGGAP